MKHIYNPGSGLEQVEQAFDGMYDASRASGAAMGVLDSAATADVTAEIARTGEGLPERMKALLDQVEDEAAKSRVLRSVLDGVSHYERMHGVRPSADVIDAAISQAQAIANGKAEIGLPGRMTLDSISNTGHHDPISIQPNRIVVAITSAIAEGIPFATYLPTDIGSNEARLGIVSHQAGANFGDYTIGELLDGINCGDVYASSERRVTLTQAGDRLTATGGIFTTTGGSTTLKLLRGRSLVFINGFPAGAENPNVAASIANSPLSGSVVIGATTYTISGTVTVATGAFALTFSPALPVGAVVEVEGHIDYEAQTALTPDIITQVQNFALFATPWRIKMKQTIDSQTQGQNEIGLDLLSESLMAARNQVAMERHYMSLRKLKALAANNAATYDFDATTQLAQKTRAMIWQDFGARLGVVDQKMAEDTMDHGISHIYVTKNIKAQMESLPREIFEPSGLNARPGIYRIGRLFGRYEIYYTPKGLTEGATTSEMLAIGRSTQVARCPIVLGDAVPPTIIPLAINDDLNRGSAMYARNFTQVNPHQPSSMGAALISVTNLF